MGRRGPRPLPSAIKRSRGTFRPHRESPSEPRGTPGVPPRPENLDEEERREWDESAERLSAMGVLHAGHGDALMLLVKAKTRYLRLAAKVASMGEVLEDARGDLYRNPYVVSFERAEAEYRRMCGEFGLTPSSATRVRAEQAEPHPDSTASSVPPFGVVRGGRRSS